MTRGRRLLVALVLVALAAGGAAAFHAYRVLFRPYRGYAGAEKTVWVAPGSDAGSILRQLEREGVLADASLARLYLRYAADGGSLKAGEYRFQGRLTTPQVLDRLIRGAVETHPVTLVEGLTLSETAAALAAAGHGGLEPLLAEMRDPARIADLDPAATDLEGYLFPDTYRFARGTEADRIVDALVDNFRRRYQDRLEPAAHPDGLRALVTLASIVEKEAQQSDERPVIAGVFANRLRRGMRLQADPTVIYALMLLGRWDGNLRRPDLELDSPYNTYRYPGLPPGPICSPGLASLTAAAQPAPTPYLYFVSRNDGSHVFAASLTEHNRNVRRWQKEYWQRRWAEERRQSGGD